MIALSRASSPGSKPRPPPGPTVLTGSVTPGKTHLAEKGLPLRALQHLARHADDIHVDRMKLAVMALDAITAMTEPPPPPARGNGVESEEEKAPDCPCSVS